jgi:hypothetical protein
MFDALHRIDDPGTVLPAGPAPEIAPERPGRDWEAAIDRGVSLASGVLLVAIVAILFLVSQ